MPFAILNIMIVLILLFPSLFFIGQLKTLPEISIEKVEFENLKIIASVRNTGHSEVSIVQADVNDRIQFAAMEPKNRLERFESGKVIIPFVWNQGEPYRIGLTTDDGTRFEKTVNFATFDLAANSHRSFVFCTNRNICWSHPSNDRIAVVSIHSQT